jgi:hypothetical protein
MLNIEKMKNLILKLVIEFNMFCELKVLPCGVVVEMVVFATILS